MVIFQDLLISWVKLGPIHSANGPTIAKALEELVLFRWETPGYIVTDNGKELYNNRLRNLVMDYGIKIFPKSMYWA